MQVPSRIQRAAPITRCDNVRRNTAPLLNNWSINVGGQSNEVTYCLPRVRWAAGRRPRRFRCGTTNCTGTVARSHHAGRGWLRPWLVSRSGRRVSSLRLRPRPGVVGTAAVRVLWRPPRVGRRALGRPLGLGALLLIIPPDRDDHLVPSKAPGDRASGHCPRKTGEIVTPPLLSCVRARPACQVSTSHASGVRYADAAPLPPARTPGFVQSNNHGRHSGRLL